MPILLLPCCATENLACNSGARSAQAGAPQGTAGTRALCPNSSAARRNVASYATRSPELNERAGLSHLLSPVTGAPFRGSGNRSGHKNMHARWALQTQWVSWCSELPFACPYPLCPQPFPAPLTQQLPCGSPAREGAPPSGFRLCHVGPWAIWGSTAHFWASEF